jgi:branched-chain amino acid transport system permease protein
VLANFGNGTLVFAEFVMIVVGGLKFGAIYSLAALGIVVIYKATRIVNFAHGAFVLAGAYVTYGVVEKINLGYWPAYVLVPIAAGLLACAVELAILRPIRQADMFALITSTIFIGIGLSEVYRLYQNTEMLGVRNPVPGAPIFLGDVIITKEQLWVFSGAVLSSLIGLAIFGYAPIGRGLRAMAANARGAVLCGYSSDHMNAMAWFLGGALAGLAGVFAAPSKGISTELAISMITAGFVAAVIGGFDSLRGALFGGLILGVAETFAAAYVSSAMKNAVSFLLLFIVLLWRPEGLFPEAKIRDV